MNGQLISDAIGGVLGGVYGDYSEQRKRQDRLAEVAAANKSREDEVARKGEKDKADETERQRMIAAQKEIIESLPDTNPDGSPNTIKTALRVQYGFKGNIGSTIIKDAGDTSRTTQTNTTKRDVADSNNAASMERLGKQIRFGQYKWDTPSADTEVQEQGRNQRWATPSGNARLGSDTTRRGQDIGASTASDRNAVTQRGQDIDFGLGTQRNGIAGQKRSMFDVTFGDQAGGDPNAPAAAPPPPVPAPTLPPRVPTGGGGAPDGGKLLMTTQQMSQPRAGGAPIPVTARAGGPAAAAAPKVKPTGNPALDTLTSQAAAMLSAYNALPDGAKKQQMLKQLQELKARRDALLAGSQQ